MALFFSCVIGLCSHQIEVVQHTWCIGLTLCMSCTVDMCNQCRRKMAGLVHSTPCKSARLSNQGMCAFCGSEDLLTRRVTSFLAGGWLGRREGGRERMPSSCRGQQACSLSTLSCFVDVGSLHCQLADE